jgi:hypothetical protein
VARVGFFTFGLLNEAYGHPQVQGFFDSVPGVFESAELTDGFVHRLTTIPSGVRPRFFVADRDPQGAQTLSVWRDLESVYAFAYCGRHRTAMGHRAAWFRRTEPPYPTHVAWWIADDHVPTWEEGIERYHHLADHGPTPRAFTFGQAFGPQGRPLVIDQGNVAQKASSVR